MKDAGQAVETALGRRLLFKGLEDHLFVVGEGIMHGEDGGSNYPDRLKLRVPRERAIRLAIEVLKSVEQNDSAKARVVEVWLFGQLK